MAEERPKKRPWVDAVVNLIVLTQRRKLEWRPASTVELPSHVDRESAVLISELNNRKLRLYSRRPDRLDEGLYEVTNRTLSRLAPVVQLDFIDDKGASLWSFPSVAGLENLLIEAQYQVTGVKDFLAEIEALAS